MLAGPDRRVGAGGARVIDRVRAARQDDRARPATLQFRVRRVVRKQLRVDIEFAHAPCDQLRELAPEIEDDHGFALVVSIGRSGAIVRGALRGRRLERRLEVGLDLGVIGCQDAVAGVGGFAMDGLAAGWARGPVRGVVLDAVT